MNLEKEIKIKSSVEDVVSPKVSDSKNKTNEKETFSFTKELEKLVSLKEKGLLTEEEFIAAKAKLLNS